jgi:hypothetical protein
MEYLKRQQLATKFEPRQQLDLAQGILQIVERGGGATVTPLLVTLFVDTAIARLGPDGQHQALPVDVPEVYLDYLDRLNPADESSPSNRVGREAMLKAAFVLAQTSLGADLVPTDFRREFAEQQLVSEGIAQGSVLVDRLIANGVLDETEIAGLSILRFQFDPVAEYLGAISQCRSLGTDGARWIAMITQLIDMKSYPDGIRGYLNALVVCYKSYKFPLKLPDVHFPWLEMDEGDPLAD